jgi:ribonuclease G
MREIMREWRHYREAKEFTIVASQTVIDMFLEDESQSLENLQAVIDCEISLHVETSYSQEQYDITFS